MRVVWMVLVGIIVLAGAAYGWMMLSPASPVAYQTPTPSPTASANPTADWKTCKNTRYGYEFKYPQEWQVFKPGLGEAGPADCTDGDTRLFLFAKSISDFNTNFLAVEVKSPEYMAAFYPNIKNLEDALQKNSTLAPAHSTNSIVAELTLDGERLVQFTNDDFWAFHDGTLYEFRMAGDLPLVRQILSTFKFTDATSSVPADWKNFSSRYFTLSFKVPPGSVVTDGENSILVSRGPLEVYAIGSDNAFMHLQRYVNAPQSQAEAEYRAVNRDVRASTITVDGSEFKRLDGIDIGSYEGTSAGRTMLVIFDRSTLYVEDGRGLQADPPYDAISIANQILSTFKFTK